MRSWTLFFPPNADCPTGPFTILQPQDQENSEFYEVQKRRATDFEALKL